MKMRYGKKIDLDLYIHLRCICPSDALISPQVIGDTK